MNIHDATEYAYKNGYEAGVKEFAERLKEKLKNVCYVEEYDSIYVHKIIDNLAKELTEQN